MTIIPYKPHECRWPRNNHELEKPIVFVTFGTPTSLSQSDDVLYHTTMAVGAIGACPFRTQNAEGTVFSCKHAKWKRKGHCPNENVTYHADGIL